MTSQPAEVDWVSGACLLVRRADAEAAGLLDERYFMYCEDVDFCAAVRATAAGSISPRPRVVHLSGRSAALPASHRQGLPAEPPGVLRKHHPGWAPLLRLYLALQGKLPPKTPIRARTPFEGS